MSAYARSDVTAHSYAADVVANVGRYALDPAGFEPYLASPDAGGGVVSGLISGITEGMFFALLAVAVALLLAVVRRRSRTRCSPSC